MKRRHDWPGKGRLEELMREQIRATTETIVDEELEAELGAARSQRVGSEYALVMAAIAVVAILAYSALGNNISALVNNVAGQL